MPKSIYNSIYNSIDKVNAEWHPIIRQALAVMDHNYLVQLCDKHWLPGQEQIFKAFSLPLSQTRYILMGESPYPRPQSANGYAFWDNAVAQLWSNSGLTTTVNRATSLRNFLKMLLYAAGYLTTDFSQAAIALVDKSAMVQTGHELFSNMLNKGFLLLNASLVLSNLPVQHEARAWQPFMLSLLQQLHSIKPSLKLLLFGKIAQSFENFEKLGLFCQNGLQKLTAEHPYNISFITNRNVVNFFSPLNLLSKSGMPG